MELFDIGLQLVEQLFLLAFRRAYITVTGQVLRLAQAVCLHPMSNHRCPHLIQVLHRLIDPAQLLQDNGCDAAKMNSFSPLDKKIVCPSFVPLQELFTRVRQIIH